MLEITFLGWQGWMLQSSTTRVLADPLLMDAIGRGPRSTRSSFALWPPRQIRSSAIPRIDAVLISHEHEDHFDIPTLSRIDRRIPIFMSDRSSIAAITILEELGFEVRHLRPGETVPIGDLLLTPFCGDHVSRSQGDEWDTLAYLVELRDENGAFFTNVDVGVTAAMVDKLDRIAGDVITCEGMRLGRYNQHRKPLPGAGQMHQPAQARDLCPAEEALRLLKDGETFRPNPGQTLVLRDGALDEVREATDFLRVAAPPWPEREPFWAPPGSPLAPSRCGNEALEDGDTAELECGLRELARHLYGSALFKQLYSLSREELQGRQPSFVLALQVGDDRTLAYAYRPQACDFSRLDDSPEWVDQYAGTITLWATDLVALFRGQIEPRMIAACSRENWTFQCHAPFFVELWLFFHPLGRPQQALEQYRRTAREESGVPIWVHGRGGRQLDRDASTALPPLRQPCT